MPVGLHRSLPGVLQCNLRPASCAIANGRNPHSMALTASRRHQRTLASDPHSQRDSFDGVGVDRWMVALDGSRHQWPALTQFVIDRIALSVMANLLSQPKSPSPQPRQHTLTKRRAFDLELR